MAQVNIDQLAEKGYNTITPMIVMNGDQFIVNHQSYPSSVTAGKDVVVKINKG